MIVELDLNKREIHDLIDFYEPQTNKILCREMDIVEAQFGNNSLEERSRYQEFIETLKGCLEKPL